MNEPTDAETLRALQFALAPEEITPDERMRRNKFAEQIAVALHTETKQLMHRTVSARPPWSQWDEKAEREADLRHESLMADESEYGPRCNLPADEGWRQ